MKNKSYLAGAIATFLLFTGFGCGTPNAPETGFQQGTQTFSVGAGVGQPGGETVSVTKIAGKDGPVTVQVDTESANFNPGETKTVGGLSITMVEVVPAMCTIDGVEKSGPECGSPQPFMASMQIQN